MTQALPNCMTQALPDADAIHLQLEHCMRFFKTLSELKGQIEQMLKQGRAIVDRRQVDD